MCMFFGRRSTNVPWSMPMGVTELLKQPGVLATAGPSAKKKYERLLRTPQLGYHEQRKRNVNIRAHSAKQIHLLQRSRISLPTEGLAFACAAGVQCAVWPLNQVGELRVDAHGR